MTKWKFEFVVETKDVTEEAVKAFRDRIRREISILAYGNPCMGIPIEMSEISQDQTLTEFRTADFSKEIEEGIRHTIESNTKMTRERAIKALIITGLTYAEAAEEIYLEYPPEKGFLDGLKEMVNDWKEKHM